MRRYSLFLMVGCLLGLVAMLSACESSRTIGNKEVACIGIDDDPLPNFRYKVSKRNVIIGAVFIESVIVPVVTVLTEIKCPVEWVAN